MRILLFIWAALSALPCHAVEVFATVPEWAALAREIGGDKVSVFAATHGMQDPHHVDFGTRSRPGRGRGC